MWCRENGHLYSTQSRLKISQKPNILAIQASTTLKEGIFLRFSYLQIYIFITVKIYIYVKNLQYCDLNLFVPSKFEEIFKNYAHTNPDALTSDELSEMLTAKRKPMDYIGWTAAFLEWKLLFYMCKDVNGLLSKETIRGVFDGSLFEQMEKGRQSSKKKA
ncbi:hypothetical protein EZV62_018505 [Acer yangbiense]|uniref:Uncharacterized protein n=1 Tax=Acer yangbiense TaxID=1000413 RepID=A0A5C7HLG7_9ROSI|nr:hypothetical protein EZV62_018505 [Acer yangbiense]